MFHVRCCLGDLRVSKMRVKNKTLLSASAKVFLSPWLGTIVAVINPARRSGNFYWTFGKILKEDTVMVFGNNSQVTAKEMDFPSGWQFIFAAQGAWKYACSKSSFCHG